MYIGKHTGPVDCMCIVVVVVILKQGIYDQVAQRVWLTFINTCGRVFRGRVTFARCEKIHMPPNIYIYMIDDEKRLLQTKNII